MSIHSASQRWHLTPNLLWALERGEVEPGVCLTLLMEHVAHLCPTCNRGVESFVQGPQPVPGEEPEDPYEEAGFFDSAAARAREYEELEATAAEELAALRRLPSHHDRLRAVTATAANPALVELLLDGARSEVHESPSEAGELAELAEAVAVRLDSGSYGRSFCWDRVTEARAHRANALRAQGELRRAEVLMAQVERRLDDAFDPFLLAEAASFAASLAKDQRRFGDALKRLDDAERLFHEVDADYELVARVRLQRASVLSLNGDPASAVDVASEVSDQLPEGADPELRFIARHNLVSYLCEAKRYDHARQLLTELAPAYRKHPRHSFRVRFHWRQGRIAHGLGELATAEREYAAAREAFLDEGLGYLAALVALDLATLYLEQGRTAEVREIALWTSTLFETQDVHQEALAALALFRQAALEDALTAAHLRRLARHVALFRVGASAEPAA